MSITEAIAAFLTQHGYHIEPSPLGAAVFATKKGRSLGIFFPYVDYIVVRDLAASYATDAAEFERLHQAAIAYVESRMRLPRVLRYTVPNIVSVGVSEGDCPEVLIRYVQRPKKLPWTGGVRDSTYLIDAKHARIYSQGLQKTPAGRGGYTETSINPTNRTYRMLTELAKELFSQTEIDSPAAFQPSPRSPDA